MKESRAGSELWRVCPKCSKKWYSKEQWGFDTNIIERRRLERQYENNKHRQMICDIYNNVHSHSGCGGKMLDWGEVKKNRLFVDSR